MTTYNIDFSDPLKMGFSVPQGTFNGPGSTSPASSLSIYGRGALEWGEAVNENQLRQNENYASASPPLVPIEGQFWYAVKLYWRNTVSGDFFRWNYDTESWDPIFPSSGVVNPVSGTIGDYFYNTSDQTLYRWDKQYKQAEAMWLERIRTNATVDPSTERPEFELLVYNGQSFQILPTSSVSTSSPSSPSIGQFWYNSAVDRLYVWDGSTWVEIILGNGNSVLAGDLDMGSNKIINLTDPANAQDAVTLSYADTNYVNVGGDTMTGFLTLHAAPVNALHAATKQYVDDQISTSVVAIYTSGTPTHKPGDIYIENNRIWIAVTIATSAPLGTTANPGTPGSTANWKHVFPAQYS